MRAANALMRSVRTAYHLGPPGEAFVHQLKRPFVYGAADCGHRCDADADDGGDRLLGYAVENFHLPLFVAGLWSRLRFPVAGTVGFLPSSFSTHCPRTGASPGGTCGRGRFFPWRRGWRCPFCYSVYVDNFAHYSILYGSIGTAIVLLIWLYMSSVVLIMGAEFNGTLISLRKERTA